MDTAHYFSDKKGRETVYLGDTDDGSDDAFSDDDSLFFSDDEDLRTEDKDKTFVLSGTNKTCQLGVRLQLNSIL